MTEFRHTNSLINETSPYLLQHAHNPVDWHAWSNAVLEKAKLEDKLILISIGYSACHWCHVMERECFEDEKVAQIMNDHFICIKIDREERPDIDQVYMAAVQLMTGHGGWPLNCFALPDGRPIYGGTYFPKTNWINILLNLVDLFKNERKKAMEYATELTEGVRLLELTRQNNEESEFNSKTIIQSYNLWKQRFDNEFGGPDKSPKFPLPNNYEFLLKLCLTPTLPEGEKNILKKHVFLTLQKMACGGIYDQLGGGFSRYSVDRYWKVPHFEKMLYDTAQLVSLYCDAFQNFPKPLFKQIVFETLAFVERELTSVEGGFYSALDADSEGVEGKYYVWTKEELQNILKEKFDLFADYFNVKDSEIWEHNNYILYRNEDEEIIANRNNVSIEYLQKIIFESKQILFEVREKRIRPGLDKKILTSWNALMAKAYIDAYNRFDELHYLESAVKNINFILNNSINSNNRVSHLASSFVSESNKPSMNLGFLEDYAFVIETLLALYETTFEETHIVKANELMQICIAHFHDTNSGMFYFKSDEDQPLFSRKMELSDNVIPASNSSIAKSLFRLSFHFENENYLAMSKKMLNNVLHELVSYGEGYSNWSLLHLYFVEPVYEVAIVGNCVEEKRKLFNWHHLPNVIFAGSKVESKMPLLANRFVENKTLIYVCKNKTCFQPTEDVDEAIKLMYGVEN